MSDLTADERRTAHLAGLSSDYAERDAEWIQLVSGAAGAVFDVSTYAPGGLTDDNIAQAIRDAYAAARAAGSGTVLVPFKEGGWNMGASGGLDLIGSSDVGNHVWLVGEPGTALNFPAPWTGEMIRLHGSDDGINYRIWSQGGIKNLAFAVESDVDNTGKGLVLDACVGVAIKNVRVSGLTSGSGVYSRDFQGGEYNSPYCQFVNVEVEGCDTNWDLDNLALAEMTEVLSTSAVSPGRCYLSSSCIG